MKFRSIIFALLFVTSCSENIPKGDTVTFLVTSNVRGAARPLRMERLILWAVCLEEQLTLTRLETAE